MTTPERRALEAHRSGKRAGNSGHPAVGARRLRAGLAGLGWQERDGEPAGEVPGQYRELAARLLISLAHLESEQGRADYGLRLLDQAERLDPANKGVLLHQRGLLMLRTGRWADALTQLTAAEEFLGEAAEPLAATLLNRGVLYLNIGDVRLARSDMLRARKIAVDAGIDLLAAMATNNLGYCDLIGGDIPAALQLFDAAAEMYGRVAPGLLPTLETDRARALLAAGLAADAAARLDTAISAFRLQRRHQNQAEAELARANAALAVGDLAASRRWAGIAMRRFRARGNDSWAALAQLSWLRATPGIASGTWRGPSVPRRQGPARVAAVALQVAGRLRDHGLRTDARLAALIGARALLAAGRRDEAASQLAAAGAGRSLPLEVALVRQHARAELALHDGNSGKALAELRAGLDVLHTRRGQLGSLELQTGAGALGVRLADMGLDLVLRGGSARQIFAWLERSRAQAFRVRPVRPPDDPEEAAVLAELRQLGSLIRTAEINGAPDPAQVARRAELRRVVQQRSWQASGPGETIAGAPAADVAAALQASALAYAGLLVRDGQMLAVTIRHGAVRLAKLGDFGRATEAARRLTADLDAFAGRRLPARLEAVIRESIKRNTDTLHGEIIAPLLPVIGDGGIVLAPVGPLASVPWSLLPGLRGRSVTVAPSASAWLTACRGLRGDDEPAAQLRPLLVAGPDLQHAVPEAAEITKIYAGSQLLTGRDATVEKTLLALDGAELAHLAAHGHHDRDNVLFSSLDLADGPLMAYDVQRLSTAPRQVVLSACDVGRTVVRPGDEILGFTAALLHLGTPTVISSVTRVADEAAVEVMTAYHRALRTGLRPAEALARASEAEPLSPFVCFGAG